MAENKIDRIPVLQRTEEGHHLHLFYLCPTPQLEEFMRADFQNVRTAPIYTLINATEFFTNHIDPYNCKFSSNITKEMEEKRFAYRASSILNESDLGSPGELQALSDFFRGKYNGRKPLRLEEINMMPTLFYGKNYYGCISLTDDLTKLMLMMNGDSFDLIDFINEVKAMTEDAQAQQTSDSMQSLVNLFSISKSGLEVEDLSDPSCKGQIEKVMEAMKIETPRELLLESQRHEELYCLSKHPNNPW